MARLGTLRGGEPCVRGGTMDGGGGKPHKALSVRVEGRPRVRHEVHSSATIVRALFPVATRGPHALSARSQSRRSPRRLMELPRDRPLVLTQQEGEERIAYERRDGQ
jgi:hypothetical protein